MRSLIHIKARTLCHAILFLVLSVGASTAQDTTTQTVGWGVNCLSDRVCELKTEITQNDVVAAQVSVFRIRGHYRLQYTIPLGVDINRGIQIAVDDGAEMATIVDSCTAYGCSGRLELDPEIIERFKEGSALRVFFVNPAVQEKFVIEFSLSGFTSGFAQLVS